MTVNCLVCGSETEQFLDLGVQPFANSHIDPSNVSRSDLHELGLCFCTNASCRHVQLTQITNPRDHFSHYLWTTSTSRAACAWSEKLCAKILSYFQTQTYTGLRVLEIASNDGTFLAPFAKLGCKTVGIDPASNLSIIALDRGIHTVPDFFDGQSGSAAVQILGGLPDIILARNVIAHTPFPRQMLQDCFDLLSPEGMCFIEFHDLDSIVKGLQYDSVYHEHYSYFSIKSISHLAEIVGLKLVHAFESPLSGGAIVCIFTKACATPAILPIHKLLGHSRECLHNFG